MFYSGQCSVCELPVQGAWSGCVAVDDIYHNSCFKCQKCGKPNWIHCVCIKQTSYCSQQPSASSSSMHGVISSRYLDTNLVGENFYQVNDNILCRNDYLVSFIACCVHLAYSRSFNRHPQLTLDKCHVCNNPITDQVTDTYTQCCIILFHGTMYVRIDIIIM